ncbi:Rrf2 family transcriptional regulator, partial [Listeria monocytogenes]|nr:Rrf2 family transcriptional regulator [Listeria monocytogenes]
DSIIHDISVLDSKDRQQNKEFITKFL